MGTQCPVPPSFFFAQASVSQQHGEALLGLLQAPTPTPCPPMSHIQTLHFWGAEPQTVAGIFPLPASSSGALAGRR